MDMQQQFAELASQDLDADEPAVQDEPIMLVAEAQTVAPPEVPQPEMVTLSRADLYSVSRELLAELMYEMAEIIMKPEIAGRDAFRPICNDRKQFSEYDTVIYHLKCKFGKEIFKPHDKDSIACKVAKVKRIKLSEYLQRAESEGKAVCVDADGLRCEWRMV